MERLFDAGRWQEGLLPQIGITEGDRQQYGEFLARMESFRVDARQRWSTCLRDPARPQLARTRSFSRSIENNGRMDDGTRVEFGAAPMARDYSCRDDYGAGIAQVSAWAGVHYFASRRGRAANADRDAVVTWPEGNGWL